jgi:tetratricopeptide (TPR) repeat protein
MILEEELILLRQENQVLQEKVDFMSTNITPEEYDIEKVLEALSKADMLSLIKQMVQLHPDLAGLIVTIQPTVPKLQRKPFNPELYRRQVAEIFYTTDRTRWGSEARAAGPLLDIVDIGDEYVEQQQYADAATLYEIIIRGILDNYDSFRWHADEGQLDDVVEDCVEGLSDCLRGIQHETAIRSQILQTLFDVYEFDLNLENDLPVMSGKVPAILVRYTTPEERRMVAKWVREAFNLDIDWNAYEVDEFNENFEVLLLGLEADDIDDETFLRLSREMETYHYIVDRLLKQGRLDEALAEAKHVEDYEILEIADILCEHGYEDKAVQLIEERVAQHNDADLLYWLQERYQSRGNLEGAMDMAKRTFTTSPFGATIERYREVRQLAQQLDRWDEVRSELLAYVKQSHKTDVEIEIALDEGHIDLALELLEAGKQTKDPRSGPYGSSNLNVGIEVAKAAEENYPQEAIEIYQRYVDMRIEWRDRGNYQVACQYLLSIRKLYQKIGKSKEWTTYIADLRERNARLPALKDEMAKAKL